MSNTALRARRIKDIITYGFAAVVGVGLLIGGIVMLSGSDKADCGGQEMHAGDTCTTTRKGSSTTRSVDEQKSKNKTTAWVLIGLGPLIAAGGVWAVSNELRKRPATGGRAPQPAAGNPPPNPQQPTANQAPPNGFPPNGTPVNQPYPAATQQHSNQAQQAPGQGYPPPAPQYAPPQQHVAPQPNPQYAPAQPNPQYTPPQPNPQYGPPPGYAPQPYGQQGYPPPPQGYPQPGPHYPGPGQQRQ